MKAGSFLTELKRRNVYKVAVAYIVACWALAQGIAQVFPVFNVSTCAIRLIVILIIIGFPVAVVLAWVFEITPEGTKRTTDTSPDEAPDIVRQLEARDRQQFVRGYLCALIYAGLGDKTKAIDYLKREYLGDDKIDIPGIRVDPMLDVPRNDPRSKTLAAETPGYTIRSAYLKLVTSKARGPSKY
jgi:hypothetical protein